MIKKVLIIILIISFITVFIIGLISCGAEVEIIKYDETGMISANKGSNGVWLGPGWTDRLPEVNNLLDNLSANQINTLYFNLGGITPSTTQKNEFIFNTIYCNKNITSSSAQLNKTDLEKLINLKKVITDYNNLHQTNFKLVAVIGGKEVDDLLGFSGSAKSNLVSLAENVLGFFNSQELNVEDRSLFDGFQLDIEPISNMDNLVEIISSAKNVFTSTQYLSIAIGQNDIKYLDKFLDSSLSKGDEVALMAYNYNLDNENDYKKAVAQNVIDITKIVSIKGIDVSAYIPLYNETEIHNPEIENVKNSLSGIMVAAKDETVKDNFARVIIYNEGELNGGQEWNDALNDYQELWVKQIIFTDDEVSEDIRIEDFYNRLNELNEFNNKRNPIVEKYNNASTIATQVNSTSNLDEKISYLNEMLVITNECFNELKDIKVPEFYKENYALELESFILTCEYYQNGINLFEDPNYPDENLLNEAKSKFKTITSNWSELGKMNNKLLNNLKKEAESLGLHDTGIERLELVQPGTTAPETTTPGTTALETTIPETTATQSDNSGDEFPSNPEWGQLFWDSSGALWIYTKSNSWKKLEYGESYSLEDLS